MTGAPLEEGGGDCLVYLMGACDAADIAFCVNKVRTIVSDMKHRYCGEFPNRAAGKWEQRRTP